MNDSSSHSEAPSLENRLGDWARDAGCRLCVLFGSKAGAGPEVEGDVDVALDFPDLPGPERRLDIIGEIQDLCGSSSADVVFLHPGTDPVLRFEVFRGGFPVHEQESGAFVEEKVRALMLYQDAIPFRRMLRERLRERVGREGRVT